MPLDDSLFVSGAVVERTVTLGDGSERKLWFKEVGGTDYRFFQLAESSDDELTRASSIARLIAAAVCEPDGKPCMSAERAMQLKPHVQTAMLKEILEMNRVSREEKKS
jgi:hypothetical protein